MDFLRRFGTALDSDAIPWKTLIITFGVAQYGLESYLRYRQYKVLERKTIPLQLKNEVDQDTFTKSQEYGKAKAQFATISSAWNLVKNTAMLQYNAMPFVWGIAGTLVGRYGFGNFTGEITRSLVFAFGISWIETVLSLPFTYYHHFVLEEKFGFNKMTLKTWITDLVKGQALSLAFGIPLGSAFLKIIQVTGDNFFLYIWLFMMVVQITAITIYPIFIVPLFNKLTPLPAGELKDRVEALATRLKFPLSQLFVIDGSKRSAHSNAYFTGLPWKKTIVIYDTLIEKSEHVEIEAVLAHELGHWSYGHTTKLLGISSFHLFYMFALFSVFIKNNSLYRSFGFATERPILIGFLLFNEVLAPTDALVKFGMNTLTRKFEFEADEFSLNLGYSKELAASLIKLQIQNLSSMDADWMYSAYHYSHPILTERLKAIGWVSDRKVGNDEKVKIAEGEQADVVKKSEWAKVKEGEGKEEL